jgi:diguanylate cyclase (GGDEF)-like protein
MTVAKPPQGKTTAFVTAPIAFLAAAAFVVVLGSLIIGARETDSIALGRQRATIENALEQYSLSLTRELRPQTVWSEAYRKTRDRDQTWMHAFYGTYLSELLHYDRIYVLSGDDQPVYAFADDRDEKPAAFARIASGLKDLVTAVRHPDQSAVKYDVITTHIGLRNGEQVVHRAVADVRNILGTPATAVVSTIVPDRPTPTPLDSPPFLLVAIKDLDKSFIKKLGTTFDFGDLEWITGQPPTGTSTVLVKARDGTDVGTLAWRKNQPGWQFVRHVAFGLALALLILAVLAAVLMRWGRRQARQLLHSEEEARLAAQTDALTGLPNRVALGATFPKLIDQAKWRASTLGVLCVDIDQFKEINDDFGNAVGDAVLLAAGKRLQGLLGPQAVLARRGGDDFMVLAPGVDPGGVAELAARIVTALAEPIDVDGGTRVFITASVGYALALRDGDRNDDLVRRVELALAKAKESGGGEAVAFAPEMDLELSHRRTLESALRVAVAHDAIGVAYQPIMDPEGRHVVAVEALARWTDPLLGTISPEVFIPLAEETGLIPSIGEHVMRRAAADGLAWPGVDVSVNVSAAQIHHGDVVTVVRDVLKSSRFPPERLEIEITESVLLVDEKRANEQIKALQSLGVKVALDDFGSGYSSLLYLRKFGFDKLKIDRSFIEEIGQSADSSVILASIIKLGLDLKMTITAEGIETPEQHRWLKASGCHQLQGFLFSRPLTAEQMTLFLAAHQQIAAAG